MRKLFNFKQSLLGSLLFLINLIVFVIAVVSFLYWMGYLWGGNSLTLIETPAPHYVMSPTTTELANQSTFWAISDVAIGLASAVIVFLQHKAKKTNTKMAS